MFFAAAGLVLGPELLDTVDLGLEIEAVNLIGEATLGLLLFSDASRIDTRQLRHEFMLPARLLGIGLPLTIALGAVGVRLLIDDIGWTQAALIAAILAPTDAALGQEVVSDPAVPARIRQGLNVESGLNDGMVVPVVALFLALTLEPDDSGSASFWGRFVLQQVGLGVLIGIVVGAGGAWLVNRATQADSIDGIYAQLATLALAIIALTAALHFDGNGFIATFVAGLAFGRVSGRAEHLGEYTEDTAQLAAAVSFFLFGNVLFGPALGQLSFRIALCAVLTLTVGRILPVALSMIGTKAAAPTVAFVGWFGPRGLASILFGLVLIEEELPTADALFAIVAWTVALSIVLHGASAAGGARAYGRWWSSMEDDERETMPEGVPVRDQRLRGPAAD